MGNRARTLWQWLWRLEQRNRTTRDTLQYPGEYNVLVIGTRNDDHQSVQEWSIKGEREIGQLDR